MNQLQTEAHSEGFLLAAGGFQSRNPLDQTTFQSWVNACLHNDQAIEKTLQLHDRNKEGDLTRTTTLKALRAEMCGYRLMGFLAGVEAIRKNIDAKGITLTLTTKEATP